MFIRNMWYVAAWSHEVSADGLMPRTLLGDPVLLYRDEQGRAVALQDRCCHRAAPLSIGRKEGGCVRCMYHGMKFAADGRCVEIPGQETIPAQARVRSYPVVERDGFIWIWMGESEKANPSQIIDFFWHDHPEWRMKPGYIHYQANYQLIVDNLLDFSHLAFVHPNTLGTPSAASLRPKIERVGEQSLRITRWYLDDEMPALHKGVATFEGRVDRWQIYEWHVPGFLLMDAGSAPQGTGAPSGTRVAEAVQFRHTSVQTPETETTSHYFFCQARNFDLQNEAMTQQIYDDVVVAFTEDRVMIEAQQKIINLAPNAPFVPIGADAGLNQARWMTDKLLNAERNAGLAA